MPHPIYKIASIKIVAPYTLEIIFDDSEQRTINFRPILFGEMYAPLRDLNIFNQVKVDPEIHTVVWPNGADFDPATLREWDKNIEELLQRVQAWETIDRQFT